MTIRLCLSTVTDESSLGLADAAQRAQTPPIWAVPFERNQDFLGREDVLTQLLNMIPPSNSRHHYQLTTIQGLGGVGKTQIAIEVVFRIREKYPDYHILWVPAMDAGSFKNAYRYIGLELRAPGIERNDANVTKLVKDALSHPRVNNWLLVIDNADDTDLLFGTTRFVDYLPSSPQGSVVVTTRNHEVVAKLNTRQHNRIEVSEFSRQDARILLENHLRPEQISDTRSTDAPLDLLADLPLAIKQAAAFTDRTCMSTTMCLEYCRSNESTEIQLLGKEFEDQRRCRSIQNPIATTWLITFRHISRDNALSARLLKLMSCVAPKDTPRTFLNIADTTPLDIEEALGLLKAYSFLSQRPEIESYDMHRLVRLAMRNWLIVREQLGSWIKMAVQNLMVQLGWPLLEDKGSRSFLEDMDIWQRYVPHAEALFESKENFLDDEDASSLGWCYHHAHRYSEAEIIRRQALATTRELYGVEHFKTTVAMENLGSTLLKRKKYSECQTLFQLTLELRKKSQGPQHPDTLNCMARLRDSLHGQKRYRDAERRCRALLYLQKSILGEEHMDMVTTMYYLRSSVFRQGRDHEAETILEELSPLHKAKLGEMDPAMLYMTHEIALSIFYQRRYQEAEIHFQELLPLHKTVLGEEHPDTIHCLHALADSVACQKRFSEAMELYEKVVTLRTRTFGAEQPNTLKAIAGVEWAKDCLRCEDSVGEHETESA
ncbi:P-loop containing nucleoside triphosphate hydrolase protein [Podospora australis]|uniref:P-loop containing nucleoside triphosphate hydrolase protein n=1 Tax=Podospora australis TaxID=1536484 RepID=A0AAN6WIQ2_9PEZI|nr:P-loop containing nucleoside triphosphate hydrolase protein [Podospora australis]